MRGGSRGKNFYQNKSNLPPEIERIRKELENIKCLSEINPKDLVKPDGWADKLANFLKTGVRKKDLKTSQLRKFFNEIKSATIKAEKGKLEEAQMTLWKVYPLIAYSEARDLMPKEFGDIISTILEKVEGCQELQKQKASFKNLDLFMTALYAYFTKYEKVK
jgi:CRISPR type III-A-associated protein Csm2